MTRFTERDNIAERILRKMIALVIAAAFILPLMMPQVFAASTVSISTKDTIKGGETFTVAVIFGDGDVSRVDAQLTYDTDMLTYISGGTSSGNSGYVQLKDAGTDGSVVFNLKFQAIADGNVMLDVSTNEIYNFDEQMMENISASKSVTIEGNAPADAVIEDNEDQDEEPEGSVEDEQHPIVLNGVDEKDNSKIIMIAGIIAAVLLILIIIIAIALKKSSKPKKKAKASAMASGAASIPEADIDDPRSGDRYEESLEEPNPLRNYRNPYEIDKELEEELQRRREEIRQQRYEQRIAARERAKAQTQLWDEWTLDEDDKRDTDDIEKW